MTKKNPHWGTALDAFLDEHGIREAAKAEAVTRVVAWQLSEEMKRQEGDLITGLSNRPCNSGGS
jgi:hypothetical protein